MPREWSPERALCKALKMTAYFDSYARAYRQVLQRSLNATGENQDYFARVRVKITRDLLAEHPTRIQKIVDFGCGVGTAAPHLVKEFEPKSLVGVDVSREILKEAAAQNQSERVSFVPLEDFSGEAELVFCNGVFHHIAPFDRAEALGFIRKTLRSGGYFALWENNPLNPGTRYVMSRCEFDRDAVVITPQDARTLLEVNGFEIVSATSTFFFPRSLAWMRCFERLLAPTMLGGQYLFLSQPRH
jgi:SAM-dependent methyltransferase